MLKKHHRKATHQGVLQGIAELLDRAGISHRAKRSSEEVNNCFEGKTLEGTHLYRVAKRKNSRTPTPCLRAFRRNRGLLPPAPGALRRLAYGEGDRRQQNCSCSWGS